MNLSSLPEKLARAQAAHPWKFLLGALAVTAVAIYFASGLGFDSSYEGLLPEDSPQVRSASEVRELTGGTGQLVVAIGGGDLETRLEFGRKLVPLFRASDDIRCVDLEFPIDFVRKRALWLVNTEELSELVDSAERAMRIYQKRNDPQAIRLFAARVRETIEGRRGEMPYDGVLTSRDGQYTFLSLIPSVSLNDLPAGRALLAEIEDTVESQNPGALGLEVRYAGTLTLYQEQHRAIGRDLRNASLVAFVLGILLVTGFTRRKSATLVIAVSLLCGIAWTYGIARIFTEDVNMVTGFLGAVLVGLGIDFGIHLFVRFQQELVRAKGEREEGLVQAVDGTLRPALTSAMTTAATFFSFALAEFPPFFEFGLIAGVGVVMTLTSTFLILPPMLFLMTTEKRAAKEVARAARIKPRALTFTAVPRPLAITIVLVFAAGAVFGAFHLLDIQFRNNFRELRGYSEATEFSDYVVQNMGMGFNPAVFLSPTLAEAAQVASIARTAAEYSEEETAPYIGRVLSVADLLPPEDVTTHQALIDRLRVIVNDEEVWRVIAQDDELGDRIAEMAREMIQAEPWSLEDLPHSFKQRFITPDGQHFVTFVWPSESVESDFQATTWEGRLGQIASTAEEADVNHMVADEALIQGWISQMVLEDAPRVIPVAALVVFLILLLDYRSLRRSVVVATPLAVGMLFFSALIYLTGQTINMFNMIVIPSVIGIGIDASVHFYHRYRTEGPGSSMFVLRHTGVAVFLASATTAIGFGSSLVCQHRGLQSLGTAAIAGIGATFVAAVLFFPAFLTLLENLKGARTGRSES